MMDFSLNISDTNSPSMGQTEVKLQKYLVANVSYPTIKNRMFPSSAAETLIKANQLAGKLVFQWQEIKRPKAGQCFLVFMSSKLDEIPPDDLIWENSEISRQTILADGKVLTFYENFGGKSPDDASVTVTRRRYFIDNKNPNQIQLLHYIDSKDDEIVSVNVLNTSQTAPIQSQQPQPIRPYMQAPPPDFSPNRASLAVENTTILRSNFPTQSNEQATLYNNYSPNTTTKLLPKVTQKRRIAKHQTKIARDVAPKTADSGINSLSTPIHGDDIDVIAARDVALFRYKRNHDYLAELFSHKTQKDIINMREPLMSSSTLLFLKQLKRKNEGEIKDIASRQESIKPSSFLSEQIEAVKNASSSKEIITSRRLVEEKFGPLVDRRKLFRQADTKLDNCNAFSDERPRFISL